jgi:hypothetical protein
MKNLIITADDYGVFPSINEGVKAAVLAGKVNSVAAISNHANSVNNVKTLVADVGDKADIGCHLTISSGEPLEAKNHEAFTTGKYFNAFDDLKIEAVEGCPELLEKELRSQVQVFLDSGIRVTNLSCHHTTLTNTRELFKVYLKVAEHFKLPIRSVNIVPHVKDNLYRSFLLFKLSRIVRLKKLGEMKRFGKEIGDFLKDSSPGTKTPAMLESRHYGPLADIDIPPYSVPVFKEKKHIELKKFLKDFVRSEDAHAELMLHLIKNDNALRTEDDGIDYPGINKKYFDSRHIEFLSISDFNFEKYADKLQLAYWKDIV